MGELLREILDGAVHEGGGLWIVADQDGIELFLTNLFGRHLPERVIAGLPQRLPPFLEDVAEGTLAGLVSEESLLVLQFEVEAVDLHQWEARGAVSGDAGRRDRSVGHPDP